MVAPDVLQQGSLPPRQPLSNAERIKNGVCPHYPRNCRFGDVCKFQHVEPAGKHEGKQEGKHVRSVGVKESPHHPAFEQQLDTLSEALMQKLLKKFSGVVSPRESIIVHAPVTSIHEPSSSIRLLASHACVRTCISKSAGISQPVVKTFIPDLRCFLSSLKSVISEYSSSLRASHECVRPVPSPLVVYAPVSPSVTYAQAGMSVT